MPDLEHEGWAVLYRAAMLEFDGDKLPVRIKEAQEAIYQRIREAGSSAPPEERQAMDDALSNLRVLARDGLRK